MKKQDVLAMIEGMPDEFDPEELMYRIYLLRKVQAGETDFRAGRFISHEEFVQRGSDFLPSRSRRFP